MPDVVGSSDSLAVNLDVALEPVKNFLRTLLGDGAPDFHLQIAGNVGNITSCCEKTKGNVNNKIGQLGGTGGIEGEFPIPGLSLKLPFNLGNAGLFVNIGLSASGTASVQSDKCDNKPSGSLSGSVQLTGTLAGKIELPANVVSIAIGGTIGGTCSITGTYRDGGFEGDANCAHNGVTVSGTVELLNGLIEATHNEVLVQPGSLPPKHFTVPFTL